jgi:hypothetical protein
MPLCLILRYIGSLIRFFVLNYDNKLQKSDGALNCLSALRIMSQLIKKYHNYICLNPGSNDFCNSNFILKLCRTGILI